MQSNQIRETFLSYFREKKHKVLPSFPLIPAGDPTLLLINAGMAPLKPYFLGQQEPLSPRLSTCQKCVRVVDIDRVGLTARHLTFFEMLGNFSFGDYFKKEAIAFAWELLTKRFGIPEGKLYVSVYEKDKEAEKIWLEEIGLPENKLYRRKKEDNFWMAGETGPCGPDSEIFYDRGSSFSCGQPNCEPGCDCDRFVELWNLVFMELNRKEDGTETPLPKKNIDTGMGLERLTMILQDVETVFHTDLFKPVVEYLHQLREDASPFFYRIISDHIRASVHLIADGVLPSNEGRGYVLRRLLRKACLVGKRQGPTSFLSRCVPLVVHIFQSAYPDLVEKQDLILSVVREEEERFLQTLEQGEKLFFASIKRIEDNKKMISGEVAFKLYDTYGFPLELTKDLAKEHGFSVDEKGFLQELEKQRQRSRQPTKPKTEWQVEAREMPPSVFVGYETTEAESKILALLKDGKFVDTVRKGEAVELVLSPTPFYAESGGQVGDAGTILKKNGKIAVYDCQKEGRSFLHKGKVLEGNFHAGESIKACVDAARRMETARNHTATHLLHAVLREVLGKQVRQAGSLVAPDYLRFDYTFHRAPTGEELDEIETRMHQLILQDIPVTFFYTDYDKALDLGALAFFGEKYGQQVRVLQIGDVSLELCGGTHLKRTLEVGFFKLTKEIGIGAGVRRIEALSGKKAFEHARKSLETTKALAQLLHCSPEKLKERTEKLLEENKALEKARDQLERRLLQQKAKELMQKKKKLGSLDAVLHSFQTEEGEDHHKGRKLLDLLKGNDLDVACILQKGKDRLSLSLYCGDRAQKAGLDAAAIVRSVTKGAGGGKPSLAQGGITQNSDPKKVLQEVEQLIITHQRKEER